MDKVINGMRPVHPGEILREEFLKPLNLSANALAIDLHVPAPRINDIVREKRGITADTALRLARYFGTGLLPRSPPSRFDTPLYFSSHIRHVLGNVRS